MTASILGPLPWSDETLKRAYFQSFTAAYEAIREHPGYDLHKRKQSLNSALRLFRKWCSRFHEELYRFHIETHEEKLMNRRHAETLQQFEESFQEALYVIASTAMTLVDQCRSIANHIELNGYTEQTNTFSNDPVHRLIQELRNDVLHASLHQPNWQISIKEDGTRTTEMMILPHQLSRSSKWHSLARQYLKEQGRRLISTR
ncbi:hypothetical protein [Methylotenera sp.]|uniref:hypothetical protein n=1 Tax=Methylotenera sp. TaxID=2051956 RepID=UPI002733FD31|nr:hypothetical protein [Methylotenera sp.]MDP3308449.1 hypothetical protein [Methylotenera sp.]